MEIDKPIEAAPSLRWGCDDNPSRASEDEVPTCEEVDTATGNYAERQTDFEVGGRGLGLALKRYYNSEAAAAGLKGIFGYGWSSTYSDHLVQEFGAATVVQGEGSETPFAEVEAGKYTAPAWSQDKLEGTEELGYTLTLASQTQLKFAGGSGRLESMTDRDGNATALSYNGSGQLEYVTDPAGRKLRLEYYSSGAEAGLVKKITDPMAYAVEYAYSEGNLKSVSQPSGGGTRWQLQYNAKHELTELIDGRGHATKYAYGETEHSSAFGKMIKITDPLSRVTNYSYRPFETVTENTSTTAKTQERFTTAGLAESVTKGYGTPSATTETRTHDEAGDVTSVTDGTLNTTKYGYDTHANRTSLTDPDGHETKWTYDGTHDVETETKPNGEVTTYKRDPHGNPEVVERPAPGGATQSTAYTYDAHGSLATMTDARKHVWKYEYDGAGDKVAETNPEGAERSWGYNEDSQETSMVSPRGHVEGAEAAQYTTSVVRDAQGRATNVTDPLEHETKYAYDGAGNIESVTDPGGHVTTYTYDADNERTQAKAPEATTETGYDGAGAVVSETDGSKHTTKYARNVLEQVTEVVDPRGRTTLEEYDLAGRRVGVTDQSKRTTHYKYDAAGRLTEVTYSDGTTPAVSYEYNSDGDRLKMVDGSGTTKYEYDQLDRVTQTEDGHGGVVGYEYDLTNEVTKLTYPNGKAVTREWDDAGRLKRIADWLEHTTTFNYDADGNPTSTAFPSGTGNVDTTGYDATGAVSEVKMAKGEEALASVVYTRNSDGQVEGTTTRGLPGEETPAYTYDSDRRLTKGAGVSYKYDEANNPTTIGTRTYSYDAARELEKSAEGGVTTANYTYNEEGERTKDTPSTGAATTLGYDQAGRLTTVARPKEGEGTAIEDGYAYDGDGLRTSQSAAGTTTYLHWELAEKLPVILSDGAGSYVYGVSGLPVEQITGSGTVTYLHHDAQGSTRLVTDSSGGGVASTTYDGYGAPLGAPLTATPFGYDGQFTDSDTGLVYLRARYYDPATAQFLSADPAVAKTQDAYGYASDDPLTNGDPSGECATAYASRIGGGTHRECADLLGQIGAKGKELKKRFADLFARPNHLPLSGVINHVLTFRQQQTNLQKKIKKFNLKGCGDEWGMYLPAEAYEWATIEIHLHYQVTP